jgi:tetratricopeptide (TPR) repeat protein
LIGFNARRSFKRAFFIFFVIPAIAGCALQDIRYTLPTDPSPPDQLLLEQVPFFPQNAYQCGPAALAMVLQSIGVTVSPDELVSMVYIPDRKGSLQIGMIGAARRLGTLAYPIQGLDCLIRELNAGHAVIVLQNLGLSWFSKWHYAVVVGYDLNRRQVILHTGTTALRHVGLSNFRWTWRRGDYWGLVVVPAGDMPACAQENAYLRAVLGLQQSGHPEAALEAYAAGTERWPQSAGAYLSLGNALYAGGDLAGSVQAFGTAASLDPNNGDAFNNLAHVLAESGRLEEALEAVQKALEQESPNRATYMQTLNDIKRRIQTVAD